MSELLPGYRTVRGTALDLPLLGHATAHRDNDTNNCDQKLPRKRFGEITIPALRGDGDLAHDFQDDF